MTTRAAIANGNFTSGSVWAVIDSTSLLASNSTSTTLTTSYVLSQTFTPGAITIDGIAVWINSRIGSTGTISVALDQGGSTVANTEIAINVADIPASGNCWVFFKFATTVTLAGATAYSVKAKTSSATQVSLMRNATAGNWSRLLRTTTTGAPGAADDLYVMGEKTGAGTGNSISVTMDNTASTTFGLMDISSGGAVAYGTSASTAYLLTLGGNLNIRSGGEFDIGTKAGTRIPSTSSGELAFSNATNVDRGIEVRGSGTLRTAGAAISNPWALLAADAAASATSLTTNISTGWKNGDSIGIASTTRTPSEQELKALTADASGTTLTIAALTNAHGGDSSTLVQAELINLTRNVKIHGTSTSLQSYINIEAAATVELEATEIYWLGSGTANKRGVDIGTTTGSFSAEYCSVHDFVSTSSNGFFINTSSGNNVNVKHSVFYNFAERALYFINSAQNNIVVDDCVAMKSVNEIMHFNPGNQVSNVRATGVTSANHAVRIDNGSGTYTGSFTNIVVHSNINGMRVDGSIIAGSSSTFSNITAWRNQTEGLQLNSLRDLTFDNVILFGNLNRNLRIIGDLRNVTISNSTIRAGVTLTSAEGLEIDTPASYMAGLYIVNTVFGGSGQTHSSGDILITSSASPLLASFMLLDNCVLNSTTQVAQQTNLALNRGKPQAMIRANFLGATQNHKTWLAMGTWSYDTSIADTSPSLRMAPLNASIKLQSPGFFASVASGQTKTVSIKVRKSVAGDGAAYNGNQPRLMVRRDYGAGITTDTVLDTATAAADGAFETLTGTTAAVSNTCALEFFVDCDGTAGWVNVDTFTVS